MGKEIERKFKVKSKDYKSLAKGIYYHQGYLSSQKERVVRIRTISGKAHLTIKGANIGASRAEFEYEIPIFDAEEMLENLCEKPTIKKYRHKISFKGFIWEVDEFIGENEGLVIAEIELDYEDQKFEKPKWIGEEVTFDSKYYNANLISNPYNNWKNK